VFSWLAGELRLVGLTSTTSTGCPLCLQSLQLCEPSLPGHHLSASLQHGTHPTPAAHRSAVREALRLMVVNHQRGYTRQQRPAPAALVQYH
jgi:phospholipase/lecithinase/hemolysin